MSKGPKTLSRIDGEIARLREEQRDLSERVSRTGERMARLREDEIGAFRELALFRLGAGEARSVGGTLERAEAELSRLRAGRRKSLSALDRELSAAGEEIDRLEAERGRLSAQVAKRQAEVDAADARLLEALSASDDYKARMEAVAVAESRSEEAERKSALAADDRTEKGKPYEADPLFMYLWNRGYGTPDYNGSGLYRMLDAWVARLVRYQDARANYYMLLEIPRRLAEHAERVREAAEAEAARLEEFERAERAGAGVLELAEQVAADEAAIAAITEDLTARSAARAELEARRAAVNRGEDEESGQAVDLVVRALQDARLADLHRAAMLTPDPADERLVERIEQARQETDDLEQEFERYGRIERDLEKKIGELEEVRGRFVGERMDTDRWEFDDDLIEDFLKALLRGAINAAAVWAELSRRGRYTPGPSRPSGPWGRSAGSGPVFRLPTGGGRGRGGFRTGGGFGGGGKGGFRTGGRF